MICLSLAEKSLHECLQALQRVKLAEIRLDLVKLSQHDIKKLFSQPKKLIATCRPQGPSDNRRKKKLLAAIRAGAAYVDVELQSKASFLRAIRDTARQKHCKLIISYHNSRQTPSRRKLLAIVSRCFKRGADLAKIACHVRHYRDNVLLLSLLSTNRPLIIVGMGEKGRLTRLMAPLLGSAFTYAALDQTRLTAPGQLTLSEMRKFYRQAGVRHV